MRRSRMAFAVVAAGGMLAGSVAAQQDFRGQPPYGQDRSTRVGQNQQFQQQDQRTARQTRLMQQAQVIRAQNMIGTTVENTRGQKLGEVYDVVISQPDGQIAYVVISRGGVLGMGENLYAYPYSGLQYDPREQILLANIDERTLTDRYAFSKDRWPHPDRYITTQQQPGQWQQQQQQQQWQSQPQRDTRSSRDRQYDTRYDDPQNVDREVRWGVREDDRQGGRFDEPYDAAREVDREVRWGVREENRQAGRVDQQYDTRYEQRGDTDRSDREVRWGYEGEVPDERDRTYQTADDFDRPQRLRQRVHQPMRGQMQQPTWISRNQTWAYRVSELMGTQVIDSRDRVAGRIDDLALDAGQGRVMYAIVDLGRQADARYVAVPFTLVELDPREEVFFTELTSQALAQAPEVTERTDLSDPRIARQLEQQFGEMQVFGFPGQQQPMQHRMQQHAQLSGQVQDVRQMNGSSVLRLQADDGQTYEIMVDDQVQVLVEPDGRAIIAAGEVMRDGRPVTPQQIRHEQQDQWQRQQQPTREGQGQLQSLRGELQQVQQGRDGTQMSLRDEQGMTYAIVVPADAKVLISERGDVLIVTRDVSSNGQRVRLQPSQRDERMQMHTLRGRVQQASEDQLTIETDDGRRYTIELGRQVQIRPMHTGETAILGERIMQNGREVTYETIEQNQQN